MSRRKRISDKIRLFEIYLPPSPTPITGVTLLYGLGFVVVMALCNVGLLIYHKKKQELTDDGETDVEKMEIHTVPDEEDMAIHSVSDVDHKQNK